MSQLIAFDIGVLEGKPSKRITQVLQSRLNRDEHILFPCYWFSKYSSTSGGFTRFHALAKPVSNGWYVNFPAVVKRRLEILACKPRLIDNAYLTTEILESGRCIPVLLSRRVDQTLSKMLGSRR